MTRIQYSADGEQFSLLCEGHAGYGSHGADIVCAGISTLVQTLIWHMEAVTDIYRCDMKDGALWCYGKGTDAVKASRVIMTGLEMIESRYPSNISVEKGCTIICNNPLQ